MRGIGIDICEVARFERLKNNKEFIERVFTKNEIDYCINRKRAAESFAARFAAKEAFSKAIGTGISKGIYLDQIEVLKDPNGMPYINLLDETKKTVEELGIKKIFLSLSHEKSVAVAVVVIE